MKIGIAGIGKMGAAIAARLSGVGHEMMVWNRSADKARATGFRVAETPAQLASSSEVVITILADASAANAVYDQMVPAAKGKLFSGHTTARVQCAPAW